MLPYGCNFLILLDDSSLLITPKHKFNLFEVIESTPSKSSMEIPQLRRITKQQKIYKIDLLLSLSLYLFTAQNSSKTNDVHKGILTAKISESVLVMTRKEFSSKFLPSFSSSADLFSISKHPSCAYFLVRILL